MEIFHSNANIENRASVDENYREDEHQIKCGDVGVILNLFRENLTKIITEHILSKSDSQRNLEVNVEISCGEFSKNDNGTKKHFDQHETSFSTSENCQTVEGRNSVVVIAEQYSLCFYSGEKKKMVCPNNCQLPDCPFMESEEKLETLEKTEQLDKLDNVEVIEDTMKKANESKCCCKCRHPNQVNSLIDSLNSASIVCRYMNTDSNFQKTSSIQNEINDKRQCPCNNLKNSIFSISKNDHRSIAIESSNSKMYKNGESEKRKQMRMAKSEVFAEKLYKCISCISEMSRKSTENSIISAKQQIFSRVVSKEDIDKLDLEIQKEKCRKWRTKNDTKNNSLLSLKSNVSNYSEQLTTISKLSSNCNQPTESMIAFRCQKSIEEVDTNKCDTSSTCLHCNKIVSILESVDSKCYKANGNVLSSENDIQSWCPIEQRQALSTHEPDQKNQNLLESDSNICMNKSVSVLRSMSTTENSDYITCCSNKKCCCSHCLRQKEKMETMSSLTSHKSNPLDPTLIDTNFCSASICDQCQQKKDIRNSEISDSRSRKSDRTILEETAAMTNTNSFCIACTCDKCSEMKRKAALIISSIGNQQYQIEPPLDVNISIEEIEEEICDELDYKSECDVRSSITPEESVPKTPYKRCDMCSICSKQIGHTNKSTSVSRLTPGYKKTENMPENNPFSYPYKTKRGMDALNDDTESLNKRRRCFVDNLFTKQLHTDLVNDEIKKNPEKFKKITASTQCICDKLPLTCSDFEDEFFKCVPRKSVLKPYENKPRRESASYELYALQEQFKWLETNISEFIKSQKIY